MSCNHTYTPIVKSTDNNNVLYSCKTRPDYLSVYYHRSGALAANKGCWTISKEEELFRFYCAYDNKNCTPTYAGLWHIESAEIYIGTNDEMIAYFPAPVNANDPWHGFPFTFAKKAPVERVKALRDVAERLFKQNKIPLKRIAKIRSGAL